MINSGWLHLLWVAVITTACVTINVYFPAAAAEKAADKIIDDVWQLKQGGANVNVQPAPPAKPSQ